MSFCTSIRALGLGFVLAGWTVFGATETAAAVEFRRGDVDDNGVVDSRDAWFLGSQVFLGGPKPACLAAGDVDGNGNIGTEDVTGLFSAFFQSFVIPAPGPFSCGLSSDPDTDLPCDVYNSCDVSEDPATLDSGFELNLIAVDRDGNFMGPKSFEGSPGDQFVVTVQLCHRSPITDWSVGISANGCLLGGWSSSFFLSGAAVVNDDQLLAMGVAEPEVLATGTGLKCREPTDLLTFEVSPPPGRGFCVLEFRDDVRLTELPAETKVSIAGRRTSVRPVLGRLIVPYCISTHSGCPPILGLEVEADQPIIDDQIFAAENQEVEVDIFTTLESAHPKDVGGWSMGIAVKGSAVEFQEADCQASCIERLIGSKVAVAESRAESVDPTLNGQGPGVILEATLNDETPLPEGKFRVGHFRSLFTMPPVEVGPTPLVLHFKDGLEGSRGISTLNGVLGQGGFLGLEHGLDVNNVFMTLVPVKRLKLGVPVDTFPAKGFSRRYFILSSPSPGSGLRVSLTGPPGRSRQKLYLGWGSPPSALEYDQIAAADSVDQTMVISNTLAQDAFFLVEGTHFGGALNSSSLVVEEVKLDLLSMSGSFAGLGARTATVRIDGIGFTEDTEFTLRPESGMGVVVSERTVLVSSRRADVVFDLSSAEIPEHYDLHAEDSVRGLTSVLGGTFEVLTYPDIGGLAQLEVHGGNVYRFNNTYTISLVVRNVGDREIPSPIVRVRGLLDQGQPCDPPSEDCLPNDISPIYNRLQVPGESVFHEGHDLFVLGVDPEGVASKLAPGRQVEIPVRYQSTHCRNCFVRFEVALFNPSSFDFVSWDLLPAPVGTEAVWEDVWPALSARLGGSWFEFNESIADLAARLSYRGFPVTSFHDVFNFAVRETLGRPSSAIVGTVKNSATREPIFGAEVFAVQGGEVHSAAVTDVDGRFAIDWLMTGGTYSLAVEDYEVVVSVPPTFTIPDDGDLLGVELEVEPAASGGWTAACESCDGADLPDGPLALPEELFTTLDELPIEIISSYDPNDKEGPEGDEEDFSATATYTIHFQNKEDATAPASVVRVVDVLDPNLYDLDSFQLGPVRAANQSVPDLLGEPDSSSAGVSFRPGQFSYTASRTNVAIDLRNDCNGANGTLPRSELLKVDFSWRRGGPTSSADDPCLLGDAPNLQGLAVWEFTTLPDPENPENPTSGFLPPDDDCGQGTGSVQFSVNLTPAALDIVASGDPIENEACIFFDPPAGADPNVISGFGLGTDHVIQMINTASVVPINLFPENFSVSVSEPVTLRWRGGVQDTFDVYVWRVADGQRPNDPVVVRKESGFHTVSGLDVDTKYHWQIDALDELNNNATVGPVWEFRTLPNGAPPGMPMNPRPLDGAGVDVGALSVDFDWDANGATAHDVRIWTLKETEGGLRTYESLCPEIDGDPQLGVAVCIDYNGLSKSEIDGLKLDGGQSYSWKVTARNQFGSTEGPTWTFNTGQLPFVRGDLDQSGIVDLTDVINLLYFLFLGEYSPRCLKAADADDSEEIDSTDAITTLKYLFLGSPVHLPDPNQCGFDPTADPLTCLEYELCEDE